MYIRDSIDYPSSDTAKMVLSVSTAQGAVVTFDLNLSDPPSVQRSGKSASLSKLRTGDSVTVTSRYNEVTLIDSVPRSANVSGTIVGKSETKTSYTIDVELDNGGGTKTYELNGSISVTRDDKIIDVSELAVDYHVAMITEGDELLSIDVDRAAGSNATKIIGTVITVTIFSSEVRKRMVFSLVSTVMTVPLIFVALLPAARSTSMDSTSSPSVITVSYTHLSPQRRRRSRT